MSRTFVPKCRGRHPLRSVLCLLALGTFLPLCSAHAGEHGHRILILHSYHPSFEWTKSIHEGIIAGLDAWGKPVNLSIEYMDTKRLYTPEHINGLVTLYEAKYRRSPPDLVISSDNDAFAFLYENREMIFGASIPVVFCAVNFFHPEDWPGMDNIVGVDERPDLEATVRLIDRLHPGKPPVAFINDRSTTGMAFRKGYLEWLATRGDAERFQMIDEGFPDDILAEVDARAKDWVFHYSSYTRDPEGEVYPPEELLERIVRETNAAVYGNYLFMMDRGIVGGPIIDGNLQGRRAVDLAVRILENRLDAADLVLENSPSVIRLDYSRVKATGISRDRLPQEAEYINIPAPFWQQYPGETILIAAMIVILTVSLATVSRLLHQRSQLVEDYGILNTELEARVAQRSEELRRTESELIRAEKLSTLGSLVAGIAHEVNTPLGLTVTAASYLKENFERIVEMPEDDGTRVKSLADFTTLGHDLSISIEANALRAAEQMKNFKQVAVDQTGESPRLINVRETLDEFLLSMRNQLKRRPVRVGIECPEDLNLIHFPGDIWKILVNLLQNSLEHGIPPKGTGHIIIEAQQSPEALEIRFSDNGPGIPETDLSRVFDPFFTTIRDKGGSGLGLHLVRSIVVDRHGGTIDVMNRHGGGVEILIRLPYTSPAISAHGDIPGTPV